MEEFRREESKKERGKKMAVSRPHENRKCGYRSISRQGRDGNVIDGHYRPSYRMKRHARNLNTNDRTIKRQLNLPEVVRMAVQNVIDTRFCLLS